MGELIPTGQLPFAIITLDLNYTILHTNDFFNRHLNPLYSDEFKIGSNILVSSIDDEIIKRLMEGGSLNCDQIVYWKDCPYPIPLLTATVANRDAMALQVNIIFGDFKIYIIATDVTNEVLSTIEYEASAKRLLEESQKCPLTNLYNRKYLTDHLSRLHRLTQRDGDVKRQALLLIDIDKFKDINDEFGHQVGDEVLCEFATRMVNTFRDTDIVSRLGGEEFLIFLPKEWDRHAVIGVLGRIFTAINQQSFVTSIGTELNVTFSAGIYTFLSTDDVNEAINMADSLMYKAKTSGRNRAYFQLRSSTPPLEYLHKEQ